MEAKITGNKGYTVLIFWKKLEKTLKQLKKEKLFTENSGQPLISYNNHLLLASLNWQNIKNG